MPPPAKVDLEGLNPAACLRLRNLIVSRRDDAGNVFGVLAPFSKHIPDERIKRWVLDEFDRNEIEALFVKLAQGLVEKYQAEELQAEKARVEATMNVRRRRHAS